MVGLARGGMVRVGCSRGRGVVGAGQGVRRSCAGMARNGARRRVISPGGGRMFATGVHPSSADRTSVLKYPSRHRSEFEVSTGAIAADTTVLEEIRDLRLERVQEFAQQWGDERVKQHRIWWSDVTAVPRRWLLERKFCFNDVLYSSFIAAMHVGALAAPFFFNWSAVGAFAVMYFVTGCLGITLSYHRQLSHKSFQTAKWLEYTLAYCGALALQGDPAEWVSSHRHHHKHCDTPKDPHSPYEGFWWSHMGWIVDDVTTQSRVGDRSNASDMAKQPFYKWLEETYLLHIAASFAGLYALGGIPWLLWGGCVRVCWVYHVTWAVNSIAHVWGNQQYNTGDLSRNNWLIGILAWGEGWHNNHHAFEYSARHGLDWWQVDVTWGVIKLMEKVGLAKNIKLPSKVQREKIRI